MNLKKVILKTVSMTAALSILAGSTSTFGIGLKQVIAEDAITPEIGIALENESYVQYQEGERTGVAILSKLTVGTENTSETPLPIRNVEVQMNLPKLNGILPSKASVIDATTKATISEKENIRQGYDETSGLFVFAYQNTPDENNELHIAKNNEKDEFEINYIYPAEAYSENEEVSLEYKVNATMSFQHENTTLTSEKQENITLEQKENVGELASYKTTKLANTIYKGFLYSNVESKTNYNTDFITTSTLTVLDSQAINELSMNLEESKFILNNEEKTEISSNKNVIYKASNINLKEFDQLLGKEGILEVYKGAELYATIKYANINNVEQIVVFYENGNVTVANEEDATIKVEYPENYTNIIMKASKPVTEGKMHFENECTIKAAQNYGASVEAIKAIRMTSVLNETNTNTDIVLTEPETRADLTISNTNLSVLTPNNITVTAILRTDHVAYKLYNNPTIEITLPEGIESVSLGNIQLLYGDNTLSIKKVELIKNKTIKIQIDGKQKLYNINAIQEGASIVIPMSIRFYKTTPMQDSKITFNVVNQKESATANANVKLLSKDGLMILTNVYGYKNNDELTVINNQKAEVVLEAGEDAKVATLKSTMVNNSGKDLKDIIVVGKISENDEIKMTLKNKMTTSKEAEIYYAEDASIKATDDGWETNPKNLSKVKAYMIVMKNLKQKEVIDFSYNFEIEKDLPYNKASEMTYSVYYNVENGEGTTSRSTVLNVLPAEQENVAVTLRTQNAPVVELNVTPNLSLDYIHEGQIAEYQIQVTNKSEMPIENLQIEDVLGDNAILTEYTTEAFDENHNQGGFAPKTEKNIKYTIAHLDPNETKTMSIFLKAANIEGEQEQLVHTVKANMQLENSNEMQTIQSVISQTPIQKAKLEVEIQYSRANNQLEENEEISYYITIKNISSNTVKNIKVEEVLDEDIQFVELIDYNGHYNEQTGKYENFIKNIMLDENHKLSYEVEKLDPNETLAVKVIGNIINATNYAEKTIRNKVLVSANGTENHESNTILNFVKGSKISAAMTSTTSNMINEGEDITYKITVKNEGNADKKVQIRDDFPEGYNIKKVIIERGNEREEKNNIGEDLFLLEYMGGNAEIEITMIVTSGNVAENNEQFVLNNKVQVETTNHSEEVVSTIESETITTVIKKVISEAEFVDIEGPEKDRESGSGESTIPSENTETNDQEIDGNVLPDEINDGNNEDNETETNNEQNTNDGTSSNPSENLPEEKYSISGIAWFDENKNGQRETEEALLSNIRVTVFDALSNMFVKNADGSDYTAMTDANGNYTLEGLSKGNYIVVFEYDTNQYTVTTYHKNSVSEELNSDVINKNATIYGNAKLVALTDTLTLENKNITNMDIGLIKNPIFDLQLDKQIIKIEVINAKGTETTDYPEGTETAKVDLVARYMKTANVVVTYRLTITNNGDIAGYVDSLTDDLPSGLEFSSELNKDWYKGSDGKLHTKALSGVAILPGESKTINLIMTKAMTEESTGLFSNHAVLEKISNLENIAEKEAAKVDNESSADLFISIKTGSPILYLGITLSCIAMIMAGAYMIKKKVLNKGI